MPSFGPGVTGASSGPMAIPCGRHPRAPVTFRTLQAFSPDVPATGTACADSSASVTFYRDWSVSAGAVSSSNASVVGRAVYVDPARLFTVGADPRRVVVADDGRELAVDADDRRVS